MARDHDIKPIDQPAYQLRSGRPADDNLDELIANWRLYQGRLILLLGAGASIGATDSTGQPFPTAIHLRNEIWRTFMRPVGEPADAFDCGKSLGTMPLDQATAFAAEKAGRAPVVEYLSTRFRTARPLWQHLAVPFLRPNAVFTTNYDLLIEQGFSVAQQVLPEDVPACVPLFADSQSPPPAAVPVFKPHGSIDRVYDPVGSGGPVITTIDYFQMLTRKRGMLESWINRLKGVCVVLVGYSMADMDIGGFLYDIRQKDNGHNWYSVFPRGDATVRKYWANRLRMQQIDRTFVELMHDLDAATNFLPKRMKFSQIAKLQKAGRIQ